MRIQVCSKNIEKSNSMHKEFLYARSTYYLKIQEFLLFVIRPDNENYPAGYRIMQKLRDIPDILSGVRHCPNLHNE